MDLGAAGGTGFGYSTAGNSPYSFTVVGVVFDDANGDGVQEPGEAGVPGVVVTLGSATAVSNGLGQYAVAVPAHTGDSFTLTVSLPVAMGFNDVVLSSGTVTASAGPLTAGAEDNSDPRWNGGGWLTTLNYAADAAGFALLNANGPPAPAPAPVLGNGGAGGGGVFLAPVGGGILGPGQGLGQVDAPAPVPAPGPGGPAPGPAPAPPGPFQQLLMWPIKTIAFIHISQTLTWNAGGYQTAFTAGATGGAVSGATVGGVMGLAADGGNPGIGTVVGGGTGGLLGGVGGGLTGLAIVQAEIVIGVVDNGVPVAVPGGPGSEIETDASRGGFLVGIPLGYIGGLVGVAASAGK